MAQLHATVYGGEYNAGDFYTYGKQLVVNLNLVSSPRAEVQVPNGVSSYTEATQKKSNK